jgi:hypothetical protein
MEARMKSYFEDYSSKRKKPWAPSTIKTYTNNITNLHVLCCPDEDFTSLEFLKDKDNVMKSMGERKDSTKRNYINSAIASLQATAFDDSLLNHYESLRDVLSASYINEKVMNKGKTETQVNVFKDVTKGDIDKLCERNPKELVDDLPDYQMNMILNLYKEHPFRNELADVKVLKVREFYKVNTPENKDNYLVVKNSGRKFEFVFNTYKTSQKLGQKTVEVTNPLITSLIMTWLSQVRNIPLKEINYKPFLCWKNGNPVSRNDLSGWLRKYTQKHLGKNISTTLLAKFYSPVIKDRSNPTADELKKIELFTKERGHSVETHLIHYNQS